MKSLLAALTAFINDNEMIAIIKQKIDPLMQALLFNITALGVTWMANLTEILELIILTVSVIISVDKGIQHFKKKKNKEKEE